MEDLTGRQFGHYQIVAPLGEGGMAAVYKAYQPAMERYVAVKVLPRHMAASVEFTNRFRREARLLAQLQHPHILPVFDFGESEDGYAYIVMPFVSSGTLAGIMHGKRMSLAAIHRIMTQVGEALAFAHAHGMIHRDIKPSNVLIDESDNCLLTDFGLARMTESSVKITTSGTVMGTPAYMSPEQGSGGVIDHRSDIYSLGVILYEMVTGRVPYNAETPIAVIFKHIQDPLPSARSFNPELPEAVELVLLKVLAKSPEDRYQSAEEFVHALQTAITDTAPSEGSSTVRTAVPAGPTTLKPKKVAPVKSEVRQKNNPIKYLLGGAVLLCILAAGIAGAIFVTNQFMSNQGVATTPPEVIVSEIPTEAVLPPITEAPSEESTADPGPTSTPAGPDEVIVDSKNVTMVLIPAGEFTMGSNMADALAECIRLFPNDVNTYCKEEYYVDETPAHQVILDAYYIDKYEVTNLLYKACVDAGVCKAPIKTSSETHTLYYGAKEYDDHPVVWVNWNMAKTYCEWRGARLPTEAEWEKAGRGTASLIYPWGDSFEGSVTNSCDANCPASYADKNMNDGFGETSPVTAFPEGASIYGVFNLSGNVSEWVADWYSPTYYTLVTFVGDAGINPSGPESGTEYVIRGGSWFRFPINLRLVTRSKNKPDFNSSDLGFRCASPVP